MTIFVSQVLIGLLILFLGETFLKNETKEEYIKEGYNWTKVLLLSNLVSILSSILIVFLIFNKGLEESEFVKFLPLATAVSTYTLVQSIFTDFKILKINRNILRVSYLLLYAIALYNIITSEYMSANTFGVVIFTGVLIFIFFLSPIGASDVRMMAIPIPYVISIGGFQALIIFNFSLLFLAFGMELKDRIKDNKRWISIKNENIEAYKKMNVFLRYKTLRTLVRAEKTKKQMATPVGPFMITPFVLYYFLIPFLV